MQADNGWDSDADSEPPTEQNLAEKDHPASELMKDDHSSSDEEKCGVNNFTKIEKK